MKRILLFDNDKEKCEILKNLFQEHDLETLIPDNVSEINNNLKKNDVDMLIIDMETLSNDSNFDQNLVKYYQEDTQKTVFFIISDPNSKFSPVNYSGTVDDVILKPYREQELFLRVINRTKNSHQTLKISDELNKINILFKIGGLPHQSTDIEKSSKLILDLIQPAFKNESSALFIINEDDHIQLAAVNGPVDREDIENLLSVTTQVVIDQNRTLFFEDLNRDIFWHRFQWNNPEYLKNAICAPLQVNGKVLGTLELYNVPQELMDNCNHDIQFLNMVISETSNVLNLSTQFSRIHKDLRFAVDELSILYEISDALSSTLNLDELLRLIVRKAMKSFEAQVVSLMMLDEDKKQLSIKFAEGMSEEIIKNTKVKIGDGIAGRVAQSGQPLLLVDVVGVEMSDLSKNIKSALSVPLKINDVVIGVINVSKNSRYRFTETDLKLLFNLASLASQAIEKAKLYQDIKHSLEEIKSSYMNTVRALSKAIEAKDPYTQGHVDRVAKYGMAIALEMDPELLKDDMFRYALVLHDIGKIQIPDAILTKTGSLTPEELDIIRRHPETGAQILQPVKFLQKAAEMVRYHQERWDGKGYPQGLKGDEIPLAARIISVADAFDAITTNRPYRPAQSIDYAKQEILKASGSQFDPEVIKAFISALDKKVIP
jgi:HD-GYP domain-containing protein (c-di-GMP phosphodiesterase class II)/CheY-like chemotaxis protein